MKKKRFTPIALILTAVATLLLTLAAAALSVWLRLGPDGLALVQGMVLMKERFVGEYDGAQVTDAMLQAGVDALDDRWSYYADPTTYDRLQERRQNLYIGVGLTYTLSPDFTYMSIEALTPGGPAERAGLQVGERITAIGGVPLTEENFAALIASIGGAPGKEVTFTVVDASGKSREASMQTIELDNTAVTSQLLAGGIGYVRIKNFYLGSAEQTKAAVDALTAQGAAALLFDVRGNPGGYVTELTDLLDYLLGEGPIFTEHTAGGKVKVTRSDAECVDLPMAVLIDADSYSAAELFAAQLRESISAPLIGTQTCGKGYYQQLFSLANGGGINLSTGMYGTGSGTSLIGVGLVPDVTQTDWDAQKACALELLQERVG